MGLKVFFSSTILDLQSQREALREHFTARHMEVLVSEHETFPVAAGVDTFDACMENVRGADAFVLLIGERFGAERAGTGKSVTWHEWEEARRTGLTPIVLVHKSAESACRKVAKKRRDLDALSPGLSIAEQDVRLLKSFRDRSPRRSNLPAVQRFIDAVMTAGIDSWTHPWDGTPEKAVELIERRLGALFSGYRRHTIELQAEAESQQVRLSALADLTEAAELLAADVRCGKRGAKEATEALLGAIALQRSEFFGYKPGDRFSLCLHRRNRLGAAVPVVRAAAGGVKSRGRTWPRGKSHVSLAIEQNAVLVSGEVSKTPGWHAHADPAVDAEDRRNYVSIISVPLCVTGKKKWADAALTLTSSRTGHFTSPTDPAVLTFQTLSRIVSSVWAATNGVER